MFFRVLPRFIFQELLVRIRESILQEHIPLFQYLIMCLLHLFGQLAVDFSGVIIRSDFGDWLACAVDFDLLCSIFLIVGGLVVVAQGKLTYGVFE